MLCCFHGGTEFASEFHLFFPPLLLSAVTSVSFGWVHRIGTSVSSYLRCKSALLPFHCHSIGHSVQSSGTTKEPSGLQWKAIPKDMPMMPAAPQGVTRGVVWMPSTGFPWKASRVVAESLLSRCERIPNWNHQKLKKLRIPIGFFQDYLSISFEVHRGDAPGFIPVPFKGFLGWCLMLSDAVWCCLMLSDGVWCTCASPWICHYQHSFLENMWSKSKKCFPSSMLLSAMRRVKENCDI